MDITKLQQAISEPIANAIPLIYPQCLDTSGNPVIPVLHYLIRRNWIAKLWDLYPIDATGPLDDHANLLLLLIANEKGCNVPVNIVNTPQFEPFVNRVTMSPGTTILFAFLQKMEKVIFVFENAEKWVSEIEHQPAEWVHKLLMLLRSGNNSRLLVNFFERSRIVARCRARHPDYTTFILSEFLLYFVGSSKDRTTRFEEVQLIVYQFDDKYKTFCMEPSPEIMGRRRFRLFIELMTLEEKETVVNAIEKGRITHAPPLTEPVMVEQIVAYVYFTDKGDLISHDPTRSKEFDLYDRFEGSDPEFTLPFQTLPLEDSDYFAASYAGLWNRGTLAVYHHLKAVVPRHIESSSKYLHQVRLSKKAQWEYEVDTSVSIAGHTHIVLVELLPPNKYADSERLGWGLKTIRLGRVQISDSLKPVVYCRGAFDGFETRMTHLVLLPESATDFDKLKLIDGREFCGPSLESTENLHRSILHTQQTERAFQRILHNPFTLVKVTLRFSTADGIIERVLADDNHRTLVVTASQTHVNSFNHNRRWLRYNCPQEMTDIENDLKEATALVQSRGLTVWEVVNQQWTHFLEKYTKEGVTEDEVAKNFPFGSVSTVSQMMDEFKVISDAFSVIAKYSQLANEVDPWEVLYNTNNVVIELDAYVKLQNRVASSCFLENHKPVPFTHVILFNAPVEAMPLVLPKEEIQVTVIGGSQGDIIPVADVTLSDSLVRSQFVYSPGELMPIEQKINPGFALVACLVAAKGQVDQAEWCVLLFQWMRIMGYPNNEITIFVASPRQKRLVEEVLQQWCGDAVASTKPFAYGWPAGVEVFGNEAVLVNFYAIISLYDERIDGEDVCLDVNDLEIIKQVYMGRFGNYVLSEAGQPLEIVEGEVYSQEERGGEGVKVETKEEMMELVEGGRLKRKRRKGKNK